MQRGLITKLIGGQYTVLEQETNKEYTCRARGKLRQIKLAKDSSFLKRTTLRTKIEAMSIKLSPKVGDNVYFEIFDEIGYIMEIEERKNELIRPDICNIDQAILIFAAKEPNFSLILLDRFIALIERENIKPVIIISKIDLLNNEEMDKMKDIMNYYNKYYDVFFTSSKHQDGLDEIKNIFRNKISVFTGQTGVGKSSLLNELDASINLKTQEISQALGRGKHTTRHTELYRFNEGYIADTPGFGSLDYGNMTVNELEACFVDIDIYSRDCKFRGCLHINEPNCNVKKMVFEKKILQSRYDNYLRFHNEIKDKKGRY